MTNIIMTIAIMGILLTLGLIVLARKQHLLDEELEIIESKDSTAELKVQIAALNETISQTKSKTADTARFISLAKKYTVLTELTQEVLHTFVSRIEVHERTIDSFGKEHQDIDIYFTHIGAVK